MMPATREVPPPEPLLPGIRAAASAPGKLILLGEHAVVYGEPCLSVAVDLRTQVTAHRVGDRFRVNGYPMSKRHHAYMVSAVETVWGDGEAVRFEVASHIPSASGLGSSAALTTATVAALRRLKVPWSTEDIAETAFQAERLTQGAGSPNDTSVSTLGGTVLVAPTARRAPGLEHAWTLRMDALTWAVHRAPPFDPGPDVALVVGNTGVRSRTATQVAKVRRFVERSVFGKDTVQAVGRLVWDGMDALRAQDPVALGRIMDRCQDHLHTMGVNHPRLQALIEAARRTKGTLGAKLTGAGGGGSMVVLTTRPDLAVRALERAEGTAFRVRPAVAGARPEPALELDESLLGERVAFVEEPAP